jgi:hypothetical protein
MDLLNGVRVKPKWVTHGTRVMLGPRSWRVAGRGRDIPEQLLVVSGDDQAEVIDAGGWWRSRGLRLRHLAMHVATDDERGRPGQPAGVP